MAIANLYSVVQPSLSLDFANVKALDPRITFSRASTARYYNGVTVAKAEENLLLRSQEFDNAAWTKTNTTITANATTAPDGTSTAEFLLPTGTNSTFQNFPYISGVDYTYSIYAKKGGYDFVRIGIGNPAFSTFTSAWFDLDTGVVGTLTNSPTATITNVGNGWYRCSITKTTDSSGSSETQIRVGSADNTGATGDGTSGIFVWGAQLEQRSAVTAYTATTTQPITNYIPALQTAAAGQARFDHSGAESLGLLVEEQRTNLLLRSEEFDNASWTKTNISVTANTIVAPDGALTGDKIVENTSAVEHFVSQSLLFAASTTYTFSVFAKKAERGFLWIRLGGVPFGSGKYAFFNLSAGTIGTVISGLTASITNCGNDWYKCVVTATSSSAATAGTAFGVSSADNTLSYTGDGYSGIFLWGAQVEAGAFATSYIPTTSASVTRSADAASMTGANFSSWFNQSEGTVYSEFASAAALSGLFPRILSISDGTVANILEWSLNAATGTLFRSRVNSTFVATLDVGASTANSFAKIASGYQANNFGASRNGGAAVTATSGALPVVSRLVIGASGDSTSQLNGSIKKISYYPAKLTSAQLQAITTA
jgi:hypothetical protein